MPTSLQIDTRYAEFLEAVELFSIAIVHSSFRIRRDEYLEQEETENQAILRCVPTNITENSFDLRATLSLRVLAGKRILIRLIASYDLHMHSKNVTADQVRQFAANEVRLVVWPFFREFVTNTTARMHIPPIILPIKGDRSD